MTTSPTQIAIVTGASRGLGLATARVLAQEGWHLTIDARDGASLRSAADRIGHEGNVTAIAGDVSDLDHRQELLAVARSIGGLDLLINNASVLGPSPQPSLAAYSINELRRVYEVNVLAPLALIQEALPLLRPRKGAVINVTSDAATEAYPGWGGYGSAKAALDQISRILAAEETDIDVYAFDPGDMNTQMHQEAFPGEDISDRPSPDESVPALLHLVATRPSSGHYSAAELITTA